MMSVQITVDGHLLRELSFFDGFDDRQLEKIAPLFKPLSFPADAGIFHEGESADHLYIVLEGRVSVVKSMPGRAKTVVSTLSRGQLLGWSALLPHGSWQASADTLKPCRLIRAAATAIRDLCESDHEIGYRITKRALAAVGQRLADSRLQALDIFATAYD